MRHIAKMETCNLETSGEETMSVVEEEESKEAMLYLDVNIGGGRTERLVIFEGESAESLTNAFANKHKLDGKKRIKLCKIVAQQIQALNP